MPVIVVGKVCQANVRFAARKRGKLVQIAARSGKRLHCGIHPRAGIQRRSQVFINTVETFFGIFLGKIRVRVFQRIADFIFFKTVAQGFKTDTYDRRR